MARRFAIIAALAALVIAIIPGSAAASVTGECDGEATIKGVRYTPANDTPANAIPIPNEDGVQVTSAPGIGAPLPSSTRPLAVRPSGTTRFTTL